jgi:hypothetical protein
MSSLFSPDLSGTFFPFGAAKVITFYSLPKFFAKKIKVFLIPLIQKTTRITQLFNSYSFLPTFPLNFASKAAANVNRFSKVPNFFSCFFSKKLIYFLID